MTGLFGVRSEEVDALYGGKENRLVMRAANEMKREYSVSELCELIECGTAKTLAEYGDDFYRGKPVLTVNSFGKGKAYYLAARAENAFSEGFVAALAAEAGVFPRE